jgi:hypothetical protein
MADEHLQIPTDTPELLDLAGLIRREHDQCREAMKAGLQHAIAAGLLLIEAKARCPKGAWQSWVTESCAMSARTAQAYMHVARHREQLEAKAQRIAGLSFRQALSFLSLPADTPTDESPERQRLRAFDAEGDALGAEWAPLSPSPRLPWSMPTALRP